MKAYILSTGDEVLLGDIVDTNAAYLCKAMTQSGIEVQQITAVGDDPDMIVSTIRDISFKADICLVTGGLGPTQDDLTASACSKAAKDRLELNPEALASMQSYFMERGFKLTRENEKQARLPSTSHIMINHNGTAPGFYIKINHCLFFFMPGVPAEMKMMYVHQVKKILASEFSLNDDLLIERFTVFGLAESKVGLALKGSKKRFPELRIGFRADFPVIEVKLILSDFHKNRKKAKQYIEKAKQWALSKLEKKVVSTQGLSIAREVGRLLTEQNKTLAVAESCTGGLISNIITDVAGSSNYFLFSGITYSNDAKMDVLKVKKKTIIEYGAVHEQTALEMAVGARRTAKADFAISTTGIAGPGGGTPDKPVGTVCIGIAGASFTTARSYRFLFDDRAKNKKMFAMMALELLRRQLVQSGKTV